MRLKYFNRCGFYFLLLFLVGACYQNSSVTDAENNLATTTSDSNTQYGDATLDVPAVKGDASNYRGLNADVKPDVESNDVIPEPDAPVIVIDDYPPGPYSLEKFGITPDMTFYDPWSDARVSLSDYYKHSEIKALLVVSSAGWCGPCLMEAAALVGLYEKYAPDGLEIIYTMGNTNIPGDVPFDTTMGRTDTAGFAADLDFMDNWKLSIATEAGALVNYPVYADPNREILASFPNHAWPLSFIVTTKDMGVRLIEEGYWSALMENKLMLCLYGDPPNLPLEW